jgi:cell division protein FtsB
MERGNNISGIGALVNRAMGQEETPDSGFSSPAPREMRVYNSVLPELEKSYTIPNRPVQAAPKNRKALKRKISPFNIVVALLAVAVVSVFYISNILTVGRLLTTINRMQMKHQQILNEQEMLKAQIDKLSGLDRVAPLAHDRIGLINPKQAPVWIHIDPRRVEQAEEILRSHEESTQGR